MRRIRAQDAARARLQIPAGVARGNAEHTRERQHGVRVVLADAHARANEVCDGRVDLGRVRPVGEEAVEVAREAGQILDEVPVGRERRRVHGGRPVLIERHPARGREELEEARPQLDQAVHRHGNRRRARVDDHARAGLDGQPPVRLRDVELVHAIAEIIEMAPHGRVGRQLERERQQGLAMVVGGMDPHLVEGVPGGLRIPILGQVDHGQADGRARGGSHDGVSPRVSRG